MKRRIGKNWIGLLALAVTFLNVSAMQAQDDLFAGTEEFAHGAKDTTEVNLNKNMMALAGMFGGANSDLVKKMDFVYVRSYEYGAPGQYKMADVEKIMKRLDSGGWFHLVKERSLTESTDVCVKSDNEDQLREMVVIAAEPSELTFIHLKGRMSLSDLGKISGTYGAPPSAASLKTRPK